MTNIFQGSDLSEIINEMFAHTKMQIENPALANSRFKFDEVLFIDVLNFHQFNLIRSGSDLSLPDLISRKGAVINPKNENDEECFKWALLQHYIMWRLSHTPNAYRTSGNTSTITIGLD